MHEKHPNDQAVDSVLYIPTSNPPSQTTMEQPASMYTLETRYQPTASKTSPMPVESNVYYIDSVPIDEKPTKKRNRQERFPAKENTQSNMPTAFLEPKVIPQPILYTITNTKATPIADTYIPSDHQYATPTIYSLASRPRPQTVDMSTNSLEIPPSQINNTSPTLYSLTSSYTSQKPIQEQPEQHSKTLPSVYSITGSSARTSRGTQADIPDPTVPAPILYTIVGETPPDKSRPKENNSPSTMKKSSTDVSTCALVKEPNETRPQQTYESYKAPTLYSLVGKPEPSIQPPLKQLPTKQTAPAIFVTDRTNRSLERKPELVHEETVTYSIRKIEQDSPLTNSTYPKAAGLVIPTNEEPPRARLPTGPEQMQRKPNLSIQNQPIELSDYRSPYAFRTQKPYRERKSNANPLPVVSNSRSETKSRQPLYESGPRLDRRQQNAASKPKSLERYPVNKNAHSRIWENDYQTQTDDDEEYESRTYRRKQNKSTQPRAPWIPVW